MKVSPITSYIAYAVIIFKVSMMSRRTRTFLKWTHSLKSDCYLVFDGIIKRMRPKCYEMAYSYRRHPHDHLVKTSCKYKR